MGKQDIASPEPHAREGNIPLAPSPTRKNAELFPDSSNVWDSLGDGLVALGDSEAAAASYRKALEIDPDAEGSRKKLEELEASEV